VAEFTVAGNLIDMFAALVAADDLDIHRGIDVPTLRIDRPQHRRGLKPAWRWGRACRELSRGRGVVVRIWPFLPFRIIACLS
jgi:hypothetical protein